MPKPQFRAIRFFWMPLVTLIINVIGAALALTDPFGKQFYADTINVLMLDIVLSSAVTVLCSELSFKLFVTLERWLPIETRLPTLIPVHVSISAVLWISTATVCQVSLYGVGSPMQVFILKENVILLTIVALAMTSLYVGMTLFQRRQDSLMEAEDLKRIALTAQNEALKAQLDPHFLFNNLNTLTALIEEQPPQAVQFVEQLSHVYRYVLQAKERDTVRLAEELTFVQSYIFLATMRFAENLRVEIKIPHEEKCGVQATLIPPMTLQLLVENAMKHNIISREKPLHILIAADDHYLTVSNPLQPRATPELSTKLGLRTIQQRYKSIAPATEQPSIEQTASAFIVRLPLLRANEQETDAIMSKKIPPQDASRLAATARTEDTQESPEAR
jgi:hypothetical protein